MEKQWFIEDQKALEEYQLRQKIYDKEVEQYARKKAKGEATEEPVKPVRPRQHRRLANDFTTEALSDILVDNPSGVLCVRDELSGWFGTFDAYRSKGAEKDRATTSRRTTVVND